MLKLGTKKIIKIFVSSTKMLNLLKSELRSIAKKKERSISGYKSMSKNELINAINISKPTKNNKNNIFKSKRKEIKESLMKPSKKKILKSIIKEIKEILYNPRNNLFKQEEDNYKPVRIGNDFSSNYIKYKSNGNKKRYAL